jgi:hypothetical protein
MRPVGGERQLRAAAHRSEGEVAGADELDADFGAQGLAGAGIRPGDVGMEPRAIAASPWMSRLAGVSTIAKSRRSATVAVLAFALGRLPGLRALARQHGPDERLRRRQARRHAALGLAPPAGALGDDAAHRFERQNKGDKDGRERERLADQGKPPVGCCHWLCLFRGFALKAGAAAKDRALGRRKFEGRVIARTGVAARR